jgi:hypothetical protein
VKVNTDNEFLVGARDSGIAILNLPDLARGLTSEQALRLAAWLIVLAGDETLKTTKAIVTAIIREDG